MARREIRVTAMGLIWQYGDVSDNPRWKGMTWGMVCGPLRISLFFRVGFVFLDAVSRRCSVRLYVAFLLQQSRARGPASAILFIPTCLFYSF